MLEWQTELTHGNELEWMMKWMTMVKTLSGCKNHSGDSELKSYF